MNADCFLNLKDQQKTATNLILLCSDSLCTHLVEILEHRGESSAWWAPVRREVDADEVLAGKDLGGGLLRAVSLDQVHRLEDVHVAMIDICREIQRLLNNSESFAQSLAFEGFSYVAIRESQRAFGSPTDPIPASMPYLASSVPQVFTPFVAMECHL